MRLVNETVSPACVVYTSAIASANICKRSTLHKPVYKYSHIFEHWLCLHDHSVEISILNTAMSQSEIDVSSGAHMIGLPCPYGAGCSRLAYAEGLPSMEVYWRHIKDFHKHKPEEPWKCPHRHCNFSDPVWRDFEAHLRQYHHPLLAWARESESNSRVYESVATVVSNSPNDNFYCPYGAKCGHSSFASEADRKQHIRMNHRRKSGYWICPLCALEYRTLGNFVNHLDSPHEAHLMDQHPSARSHWQTCSICGMQGFTDRGDLRAHTVECHTDFFGEQCWHPDCRGQFRYASNNMLEEHVEEVHQIRCRKDGCENPSTRVKDLCKQHLDQQDIPEQQRNSSKMTIGSIINPEA